MDRQELGDAVWERLFKALSDDANFEYSLVDGTMALGEAGGAYVIVSGKASTTDSDLIKRTDAMRTAMADAKAAVLDFYDGPRVAGWVNDHPGVALWVRQVLGQPLSCWKPWGSWSNPAADGSEVFLKDDKALRRLPLAYPPLNLVAAPGIENAANLLG